MIAPRFPLLAWLVLGGLGCTTSWHPPAPSAAPDAGSAREDAGAPQESGLDAGDLPDAGGVIDGDAGVRLDLDTGIDAGCGDACLPPPSEVRSSGLEGERCLPEGALTCAGQSSARRFVCRDGALRYTEPCARGELCDATPGVSETGRCVALGQCDAFDERTGEGCVGSLRVTCDAAGAATALVPCPAHAHCEKQGACSCDDGYLPGEFSGLCEPFQFTGVASQAGGGAYCGPRDGAVLGAADGFWVALLYRTQDRVVTERALASQHAAASGWALVESAEGLRFELGTLRAPSVPGAYLSDPFVTPEAQYANQELQLAVGVFDGRAIQLYVGGVAVGSPRSATFTAAPARMCVLGELGTDALPNAPVGSSVTAVFGLAGGSPALSSDELANVFAATRRDGLIPSVKDKTQFSFRISADSGAVPEGIANAGASQLELLRFGRDLQPSGGPVRWAY